MIVENHDDEVGPGQSSLMGRVGHNGTVDYPYQAEMWAQDLFSSPTTRRVYVHNTVSVHAVWGRDEKGNLCYIARNQTWGGAWELPALFGEETLVPAMTQIADNDYANDEKMSAVLDWAGKQLEHAQVATAIAFDSYGVVAAWEKSPAGPVQVAKAHRPLRAL